MLRIPRTTVGTANHRLIRQVFQR